MSKRHAPAVARNREPILEVLRKVLPSKGSVLEVASGTGEHAVFFAAYFPELTWQPTDPDPASLDSIQSWQAGAGLSNLKPPVRLDVLEDTPWPMEHADVVLCINMVHISPWSATLALLERSAALLNARQGKLILYGPYLRAGVETAPSNLDFDAQLKSRNPEWGIRSLEQVTTEAARFGFASPHVTAMPSNNLTVVFPRAG